MNPTTLTTIAMRGGGTRPDDPPEEPQGRELDVKLDVGNTFALAVLGAVALAGTIVLYYASKNEGAVALLGVTEAILFGGFGIAIGESRGAKAVHKLRTA